MYYVYVLQSMNGKIYVGCTNDLERRLEEHRQGKTYTTSRMKELKLVYYEGYMNKKMAFEREKKLKQYGSSYHGLMRRIGLK